MNVSLRLPPFATKDEFIEAGVSVCVSSVCLSYSVVVCVCVCVCIASVQ